MNLFSVGYLFGRLSSNNNEGATSVKKVNDKAEYSCLWWGKEANREDLPKAKIVTRLVVAYHNGLVNKKTTNDGLCIFVPKSKKAKEKVLIEISKIP
jgi:hypothetical protein